jgi:tRNA 2-thiouridine synthesizing protein A
VSGLSAAPGCAADLTPHAEWDAGDTGCGELVLELRSRVLALDAGQRLRLVARDPGATEDIPAWCRLTGHSLLQAAHPLYLIQRRSDP